MLVHLDGPGEHAERQLHAIHKDEHHYENPNHAVRTEDILHGDSVWLLAPHKTHSWQGIIHAAAWSSTPPASLRDLSFFQFPCAARSATGLGCETTEQRTLLSNSAGSGGLPQNHQKVSGHVSNHYARKDRHAKLKGVGSGWSQHDHLIMSLCEDAGEVIRASKQSRTVSKFQLPDAWQASHESNRRDCSGDVDDTSNQVDGVGDQRPLILEDRSGVRGPDRSSMSLRMTRNHMRSSQCPVRTFHGSSARP